MKIIYVFERRHGYSYDIDMFQMDVFLKKHYEVEVWSTVNWTFNNIHLNKPENADDSGRTIYIDNYDILKKQLNYIKNKKCIFLIYPYHAYSSVSFYLRKEIKKRGFEFCNIIESPAADAIFDSKISDLSFAKLILKESIRSGIEFGGCFKLLIYNILKNRKGKVFKTFGNCVFNLHCRLVGPVKYKSLYNFIPTEYMLNTFPNYFEVCSKRNILIHSLSYDEYIETIRVRKRVIESQYAVYIDDYEVGHSDFIKMGMEFPIKNSEEFFDELDDLFSIIEREMNLEVVIALHPKAEYKGNEFKDRKKYQFITAELIAESEIVICGASTCVGNILINKKKYLPIYSSEYFDNAKNYRIAFEHLEFLLQLEFLNIKDSAEREKWKSYIIEPNNAVCQQYIEKYVISPKGITDRRTYEVIEEYINKINN